MIQPIFLIFILVLILQFLPWTTSYCISGSSPILLSSDFGNITDGTQPLRPYQTFADCRWLIQPKSLLSNESVAVRFTTWELEEEKESTDQRSDKILIYNGNTISENAIIGRIVGSSSHSGVTQEIIGNPGNPLLIRFVTDSAYEYDGFSGVYYIKNRTESNISFCPNSCFSNLGRGICVNNQCQCNKGYSGMYNI